MCEQVLCGLLHGAGVHQGLHGMLSGETHVHQLERGENKGYIRLEERERGARPESQDRVRAEFLLGRFS